jgi:hypothetical protein
MDYLSHPISFKVLLEVVTAACWQFLSVKKKNVILSGVHNEPINIIDFNPCHSRTEEVSRIGITSINKSFRHEDEPQKR